MPGKASQDFLPRDFPQAKKKKRRAVFQRCKCGSGSQDLAEMTDFVAALRQNIEAIIIRQRLVGPVS